MTCSSTSTGFGTCALEPPLKLGNERSRVCKLRFPQSKGIFSLAALFGHSLWVLGPRRTPTLARLKPG